MKQSLCAAEAALLAAVAMALVAATLGPNVAQYAHYHVFADRRALLGLPFAMDVMSNLPFAVMGAWGLARMHVLPNGTQRTLSGVFFVGLLVTAACSTWYHLRPDDSGLVLDRLGMLLVLGMAARRPIPGPWGVPLGALITWYAVAKFLELGDQTIFSLTHGLVSGHSLKHVAAALSAWPVIALMHNGGHVRFGWTNVARS